MIKKYFFFLFFSLLLYLNSSCEKDLTPAKIAPEIKLSVEDIGVTEVWLRLNIRNLSNKNKITITRNDSAIQQFDNSTSDTIIYDSGLLPEHEYTYTAASSGSMSGRLLSEVEITTMDTTSHNFAWQTWTFGEHSSSVLYDVAIINENNIWAVGEIYLTDSIGNDLIYNAIHWDGNEWIPKRIKTNSCGGVEYPPIETIFVLFDTTILFAHIEASITRYDGNSFINDCSFIQQINGAIHKIWGTSNDDFYVVGNDSMIAYYNGQTWQRIESGSNLQVYDILGQYDSKDNNHIIYSVAANHLQSQDKKIFEIKNMGVIDLPTDPILFSLHGIWFKPPFHHYVVGSGIYKKSNIYSNNPWLPVHYGISNYYIYAIRGNDINDIVMCGSFGELLHYNGMNWKSYRDLFSIDVGALYEINI